MALGYNGFNQEVESGAALVFGRNGFVQPVEGAAGGGIITGGGVAGQVAFFSAATAIAGDTGLTYDGTSKILSISGLNPRLSVLTSNGAVGSVGVSLFHTGSREYILATDAGAGGNLRLGHGVGDGTISTNWLVLEGATTRIYFGASEAVHIGGAIGIEKVYRFMPDNNVASLEVYRTIDVVGSPVNYERFQVITEQVVANAFTIRTDKGGTGVLRDLTFHAGSTPSAIMKSTGLWGFGTTTPRRYVDILDATNPQLRVTHTDNTHYADFQAGGTGILTITASGGAVKVAGSLRVGTATDDAATTGAGVIGLTGAQRMYYDVTNSVLRLFNSGGTGVVAIGELATITGYAVFCHNSLFTDVTKFAVAQGSSGDTYLNSAAGQPITLRIGGADKWHVVSAGGFVAQANLRFSHGTSALATTATEGFFFIQSCAGTPTGVPGSIPTGQIAAIYDTSANKIWFYNGSWRGVAVT